MGYDMTAIGDATEAELEAYAAAGAARQDALEALKAAGLRPRWSDDDPADPLHLAYEAANRTWHDLDTTDYCLNVWAMGIARDLMDRMGMLLWVPEHGPDSPLPRWPKDKDVAAERTRLGRTEEEDDYAEPGDDAWTRLAQPRLAWAVTDSPHLLGHKLGSNDPWLITVGECRAVASRWRQLAGTPELAALLAAGSSPRDRKHHGDTTELPDWWDSWMAWHERCGRRGGYTQG